MPGMMEIYKKYSTNYDELVSAEDYEENLAQYIKNITNWENKSVYEAGIGTGRLTRLYIDKVKFCYGFDRENHMLKQCANNLKVFSDKLMLNISDNCNLSLLNQNIDVFIEGWSFGHTIVENKENFKKIFANIYNRIIKILDGNGKIVIIESLGTNVSEPTFSLEVLGNFYNLMEEEYKFKKVVLRTDYKFPNFKEAARIMGFFFGDYMKEDIINHKKIIIEEYTGVWTKDI